MSKLLERLRSKKDDNRNRGNRKGEGPKPMHSKKKQKEFEKEQGKKELEKWNIYGDPDHSDPILKKGYVDQTSMDSAVKRWKSDTPLMQTESYYDPANKGKKKSAEREVAKFGVTKGKGKTKRAEKRIAKEAEKQTDEYKAKKKKSKEKATEITNTLGKALEHFATGEASETVTERKEKKKSEEAKREKTKVKDPFAEENKTTTKSDEGKKDVIKVDSSTASTAPPKRKGSPFTLQNLGPEVETKKKRGINPAAAALGGAALGGLAVHLINKKKDK